MTHRDGFPRLSARSAWRGDAGAQSGAVSYNGQTTSIITGEPVPLDHLDRTEQPFDVIPVFRVVVNPRAGIED